MTENKQSRAKALLRIFKEAKPIWGWLLLSCLLCLISIVFTVISPKMLGELVQQLYDYWSGILVTDDFAGMILSGLIQVGGQAVLGRQLCLSTPWLTERHGYDPTSVNLFSSFMITGPEFWLPMILPE